jgi:hypothetical protein
MLGLIHAMFYGLSHTVFLTLSSVVHAEKRCRLETTLIQSMELHCILC